MLTLSVPFVLAVDDYHEFDVALDYIHAAVSNGYGFTEKKKPLDVEEVGFMNGNYMGVVFAKGDKPSPEKMCALVLHFEYASVYSTIAKAKADLDGRLDNQGGFFESADRDEVWRILAEDSTFLKPPKAKKT